MNVTDYTIIAALAGNGGGGGGGGGTTDPYAGYDLVVSLNDDDSTAPWVVIKGDFAATKEKLIAGQPCNGLAFRLSEASCISYCFPIYKFEYRDYEDNILMMYSNLDIVPPAGWVIMWLNDGSVIWGD